VHSGMTKDSSCSCTLLSVLAAGLAFDSFSNHICIFLPDCSLSSTIFHLSKHADLSISHLVTNHISSFIAANELHCVDLFRHSIKWLGLPGKAVMDAFTEQEQWAICPPPLYSHQRNTSCVTFKQNTLPPIALHEYGNQISSQMAGHPPSILEPSPKRTIAHPCQQSSLHVTTHSHPHTLAPFRGTQETTLSAPATLIKHLPPHPPHQKATIINVSGLDQDVSQTRQPMSSSSAPSTPPHTDKSLEFMPPILTSLELKTEAANLASSNVPPTNSYAPFPPGQTHLNWQVLSRQQVVYGPGNPWVYFSYPYPHPPKPLPITMGKGTCLNGWGLNRVLRV